MSYPIAADILLVEDNLDDAEFTIRELRRHNLTNKLYHVEDGQAALDFLFGTGTFQGQRSSPEMPKVILLDIQMPKLNGIEVLRRIKANRLTSAIPVVILTSSNESPDIKACYDLGVNSYIVKPVSFEHFSSAIKTLGFYWLLLNKFPEQNL